MKSCTPVGHFSYVYLRRPQRTDHLAAYPCGGRVFIPLVAVTEGRSEDAVGLEIDGHHHERRVGDAGRNCGVADYSRDVAYTDIECKVRIFLLRHAHRIIHRGGNVSAASRRI